MEYEVWGMRYGVVWEQVLKDINGEAMRLVLVRVYRGMEYEVWDMRYEG